MCVYHYTLWEDLRALYHLPEPLRKNNALSVILIMAVVSESKGDILLESPAHLSSTRRFGVTRDLQNVPLASTYLFTILQI